MKQEMRELILQQVREGKLTIDEALTQLERLEKLDATDTTDMNEESLWDEEPTEKVESYSVESLTSKLTSAVEGLVSRLRENDFSFSSNLGPEVTYVKQFPFTGTDVHIDLFNASTSIVTTDKEECELIVTGRPLRQQDADKSLEQLQASVKHSIMGDRLVVQLRDKLVRAHVELLVPHHQLEHVTIQTLNGDVHVSALDAEHIRVQTANGRVHMQDVHGSECLVTTGNGIVEVMGAKAELLHVRTGNGSVIAEGDIDQLSIKTGNGDVRTELMTVRDAKLELASLAGNIRIVLPHGAEVRGELDTNFGGLHCTLEDLEIVRDRKEIAQRKLEFISGRGRTPLIQVEAGTRTGTIDLENGAPHSPAPYNEPEPPAVSSNTEN